MTERTRPRHHLAARWLVALLAPLALVAAACGDDDDAADVGGVTETTESDATDTTEDVDAPDPVDPETEDIQEIASGSITVEDQQSDVGGSVLVQEVSIEGIDGWVAIHPDEDGAPGGEILGTNLFSEGDRSNLLVTVDEPLGSGTYWAMLHVDALRDGVFEFPGPDVPVLTDDGEPVMASFELAVTGRN
ncbi:MAG TPA: hypothetical protein VK866_06795 [Acidimicrobiales bacterium]|nr:hypothetical protein [Acidimicrobiales bacterium]